MLMAMCISLHNIVCLSDVGRREVERLEEEHCLAEARRLSLLASQEANREELKQKEEELHRLSTNVINSRSHILTSFGISFFESVMQIS